MGTVRASARELAERTGRPVFCTSGAEGIVAVDPRGEAPREHHAKAAPVSGPIDSVGAGDSVNAALACALCAGASLPDAAAFANLVASITIQQIGTTGTATPEQIWRRWTEAGEG
jgi:sugar/nucleoside kinase (ribokinase family)